MCLTHLIQTLQYYDTRCNVRLSKIFNISIAITFHVPRTFDEASTIHCHILGHN